MHKLGWSQFIPFMATVIGVVFTDLLQGIALGMVVAIFYILRNNFRNRFYMIEYIRRKDGIQYYSVGRGKFFKQRKYSANAESCAC